MDKSDEQFANDVGQVLRRDGEAVPPDVARRLQAARREAVEIAGTEDRNHWWAGLSRPMWASAAALVLAVSIVLMWPGDSVESLPDIAGEEFAVAQEVELLEDLEFVAWVAAMEAEDDAAPRG